MLNLNEPPPPPPPGKARPRLYLVPRMPRVVFSIPTDPEIPWYRKLIWGTLAMIITVAAATGIILFAALVKHMYDTVGARSARPPAGQTAPEGTIPLSLSERPPEKPEKAATEEAATEEEGEDQAP